MLAGIYYGAQYGGSTTAILVNIPGEATSVVTTLDGHQMAKQGRAGVALGIAAIGSFIAGSVATIIIAALAAPLTAMALLFGPADYFSLMVLGLMFAVVLARGSVPKAIAIILVGILLSTVGTDLESGEERLTFGWTEIADGLDVAVIAMGMFGFAEILRNLETTQTRDVVHAAIGNLLPNRQGLQAGGGADRARHASSARCWACCPATAPCSARSPPTRWRRSSPRTPRASARGAIEGVAGPESANNAGAQTAFIPLLTLGIPPNAVMALMVGAMTIHGIVPGPQIMTKQPQLFWGMIASMWIGNLMLLIINLPLIGLWVRFLKVPYRLMFPSIVLLCCIGIYSVNNSPIEVVMTAAFGLFGYALVKFGFEPAPLLLGFVLGRLMEEKLRQALVISRGHMTTFVDCQLWLGKCDRPISTGLLVLALLIVIVAVLPSISKSREEVFQDAD